MPPLPGFTDSPLRTRTQVAEAAEAILEPLAQYTSPGHSRVRIPITSGTLYDETAAQLEGFSRPLWVTASLIMSGQPSEELTENFITGLTNGVNPEHVEYWGDITDFDQRMVETETLCFALLGSPRHLLWDKLSTETHSHIARWFQQLNGKALPRVNWLWFRVFTNLVLIKLCEIKTSEILNQLKEDLDELDTFYLQDGWSSDGKWRGSDLDDREWGLFQETGKVHSIKPDRCVDFYSGSFALQFCQLLYIRFAGDLDPERTERYRQQARDFGAQFWTYFDEHGAVIPFGRSLTYRFACGAYFAALALAKVPDMPEPLHTPGAIKGFLLRHLRWWSRNSSDIFRTDGTLNFGWVYPNMYLTEDYNSPQSVYWALKGFIAIGLPESDPFWTESELPYPQNAVQPITVCAAARQIICNYPGNHHFLLSAAQFTSLQWAGGQAKYCKFAYSSAFGFSVPTGHATLQQLAPDNMLVLSRDGTQSWAMKWKCCEAVRGEFRLRGSGLEEMLPSYTVKWYPWEDRSVEVLTTLIAPSQKWPDWHVRIHRITGLSAKVDSLHLAEGGFAIHGRQRNHMPLPRLQGASTLPGNIGEAEFIEQTDNGALIASQAGVSGLATKLFSSKSSTVDVTAFQPEANTNLMTPRTLMPLAEHYVKGLEAGDQVFITAKVFTISTQAAQNGRGTTRSLGDRWMDRPVLRRGGADESLGLEYIDVSSIFDQAHK